MPAETPKEIADRLEKAAKKAEQLRKNCREAMKMIKEEYPGEFTGKNPMDILEYFTALDDVVERWETSGITDEDYIRIAVSNITEGATLIVNTMLMTGKRMKKDKEFFIESVIYKFMGIGNPMEIVWRVMELKQKYGETIKQWGSRMQRTMIFLTKRKVLDMSKTYYKFMSDQATITNMTAFQKECRTEHYRLMSKNYWEQCVGYM